MKRLIILLICSLSILSMDAQNIIRPKIEGPNGLYVNSYNGVLFFGRTDIETQNTAMPMQLRFYYNSSFNNVDYGYGLGFSLGYEMRYDNDTPESVVINEAVELAKRFSEPSSARFINGVLGAVSRNENGAEESK